MNQLNPSTYDTAWSGPRLLVPITLQALVLRQDNVSSASDHWSVVSNDYAQMLRFTAPAEPTAFSTGTLDIPGTQNPWTGVVLHWALPDALTHGRQASASPANSEIQFPYIPNRWLVVRTCQNPNQLNQPAQRLTKAWVIESDFLSDTPGAGSNNFLTTDDQQQQALAYLGRCLPLDQWLQQWQPTNEGAWLTATGPGDPTFPAYIANINNVLSFQDDLSDLSADYTGLPGGYLPLTYLVAGWYADPTTDPFFNATTPDDWWNLMSSFDWSADQVSAFPQQLLCHAMVYDVQWGGPQGAAPSGIPSIQTAPLVAVGNTATEALAALIEQQLCQQDGSSTPCPDGAQVAEIMEAFQYNLLSAWDQPGGQLQIDQQCFRACFGSTPGGTYWEIIAPQSNGPSSPPAPPAPPVLTPEQSALLRQLNALQAELDQQQRLLATRQWELYGLWWMREFCVKNTQFPTLRVINQAISVLQPEVAELINAINQLTNAPGGLNATLAQLNAALGTALQLTSHAAPRFAQPVDPVVLLCGAKGSFKHGPDGRLSSDGSLPCRVTAELITAMTVTAGAAPSVATVAATELNLNLLDGTVPVPAALTDLFNACTALLGEALLLDTTEATMIAQLAQPALTPPDPAITVAALAQLIQTQQTVFWNSVVYPTIDQHVAAQATGFNGDIPYVIAVAPWSPPWSPLYLDWQVTWIPSYTWIEPGVAPNPAQALNGWAYDDLGYQWTNDVMPDPAQGYLIQGRTLLTPQAADTFAARVEELLYGINPTTGEPESPPSFHFSPPPAVAQALGEVLQEVGQWDLLSQSLSGFHQQLIQRDQTQHVVCNDAEIAPLIGPTAQAVPIPETFQFFDQQPIIGFNPIRAGHFVIQKLWVIDDFGQVFDVGEAMNNQPDGPITPTAASQRLKTPNDANGSMLQLAPRVVQPTRLSFQFVSALDDSLPTVYAPDANPVCGWVLPNHLDQSLAIYAADGASLGALQLVGGSFNPRLRWNPVPGTPTPVGAPPDIANPHLRGFIEGLLAQPDGGAAAFGQLSAVIDETLWTIDPLGGRKDQTLSALIGRPLALARANLQFELYGDPVYDQDWTDIKQGQMQNTAGFTQINFTVKLGSLELPEDGLLGYFAGDDYTQFNALHQPEGTKDSPRNYVVHNNPSLSLNSDAQSPPSESQAYLTLLLDPRGCVHASTGILPMFKLLLPTEYAAPALAVMDVTFMTGPLLTATEQLQMPIPATQTGQWSWVQHPQVTVWQETSTIAKADATATLSDLPLALREGWLKLSGALTKDDKS